MITYFTDIYDYHHWANARMIGVMVDRADVPSKATALFSHLLNTYFVWLSRIEGATSTYAVWQEHPIASLEDLNIQSYRAVIDLLKAKEAVSHLETTVHYQNTKGIAFKNTVAETLTHVANHTTHHRAQVALELRRNNIAPPATDYIYYKRT